MPISQKTLFFLSKNTTFQVRSYRKSLQNLVQNAFEKNVVRKSNFGWILGSILGAFGAPKWLKITSRIEVKKAWKIGPQMSSQDPVIFFRFRCPVQNRPPCKLILIYSTLIQFRSCWFGTPSTDKRCGGFSTYFGDQKPLKITINLHPKTSSKISSDFYRILVIPSAMRTLPHQMSVRKINVKANMRCWVLQLMHIIVHQAIVCKSHARSKIRLK